MLKLKPYYSDHLMRSSDSLEKALMLGKTEGGRMGRQRMRWLDDITDSIDMSVSRFQETVKTEEPDMLWSMRLQRIGHDFATEHQQMSFCPLKERSLYCKIWYSVQKLIEIDKLLLVALRWVILWFFFGWISGFWVAWRNLGTKRKSWKDLVWPAWPVMGKDLISIFD